MARAIMLELKIIENGSNNSLLLSTIAKKDEECRREYA